MLWVRLVWLPLHAHQSAGEHHLNEKTALVAAQLVSLRAVTTSPLYSGPIKLFYLLEYSSTLIYFLKNIALTVLVHKG